MTGLTDKQRRFVEEYAVDFNATQAAIRAGYSEKTARSIATENLSKPVIKAAVAQLLDSLSMTAEEAIKRLTDMARASWFAFVRVDEEGRVWFNLGDPEAQKHFHLIKKIKTQRRTIIGEDERGAWEVEWVEVELHDAKDAIDKILRARGTYGPRGSEDDPLHMKVLKWADE